MLRYMLKSKIHRATVTQTELQYEGSLTLDSHLMEKADILPNEKVMVYNISNGERFDTYVIKGKAGTGTVCVNGAAARKACKGDLIIIVTYGLYTEEELKNHSAKLVLLDENNGIKMVKESPVEEVDV